MSFLNGLSAMGASIAQFAGAAGLEQQKADLAAQNLTLADQLQGVRETAGRAQAGEIAAAAADKEHGFLSGENAANRTTQLQVAQTGASATIGSANISAGAQRYTSDQNAATSRYATDQQGVREREGRTQAAQIAAEAAEKEHGFLSAEAVLARKNLMDIATGNNQTSVTTASISAAAQRYGVDVQSKGFYASLAQAAPEAQARAHAQQQQTALAEIQTANAADLRDLHTKLAEETGKDAPDAAKVQSLTTQITSLEKSASSEAAVTTANVMMFKADVDAVEHLNTQLTAATAALNAPEMSDTDRTAQKALIGDLRRQLAGARRSMEMSSQAVHSRVATASGAIVPQPTTGTRPPLSTFGNPTPTPSATAAPPANPNALIRGGPQ